MVDLFGNIKEKWLHKTPKDDFIVQAVEYKLQMLIGYKIYSYSIDNLLSTPNSREFTKEGIQSSFKDKEIRKEFILDIAYWVSDKFDFFLTNEELADLPKDYVVGYCSELMGQSFDVVEGAIYRTIHDSWNSLKSHYTELLKIRSQGKAIDHLCYL